MFRHRRSSVLLSHHAFGGVKPCKKVKEKDPWGGAVCAAGEKKGTVRKKRRGVRRTLYPGYLLSAREGVVEARDVGHDGLFIRTGSAHNVCEGGGRGGWGGGVKFVKQVNADKRKQQ